MFGVAFAFQSTVSQFTDLGFAGSIVALAGERGTEPTWLGRYMRAARYYRARMLLFALMGAAVAFPLLVWSHDWGLVKVALLFGAIALAVIGQGWMMYGSPLLVHRRLGDYYRPQIIGAAARLAVCLGLFALGWLSGWTVAWLGALGILFTGWSYRRSARVYVVEPVASEPDIRREMLRYLAPLFPGAIFTAFQMQITMAIITAFGSTESVAEVAALGRIGQLFYLLTAFNSVIIEPYVARLPAAILRKRYIQILSVAVLIAIAIGSVGACFPETLLWLLGPKYNGLEREMSLIVITACIGYVSAVMWTMQAARKWIWWWGTIAYICTLLVVQSVSAWALDLSQTMNVLMFSLITSLALLPIGAANAICGFRSLRK